MSNAFCANCGASVEGVAFCATCGAPVAGASAAPAGAPTAVASSLQSGPLGFIDAIKSFFMNYANFQGRASRSAYWYATLATTIASSILGSIGSGYNQDGIYQQGPLSGIFAVAVLVPGLAVAVRRLHDMGRSGKSLWFLLIPFAGPIIVLVWLATASEPRDNQYGPRA
jgi:uncharacterized membrane protein YhaH (DUF805 family)